MTLLMHLSSCSAYETGLQLEWLCKKAAKTRAACVPEEQDGGLHHALGCIMFCNLLHSCASNLHLSNHQQKGHMSRCAGLTGLTAE